MHERIPQREGRSGDDVHNCVSAVGRILGFDFLLSQMHTLPVALLEPAVEWMRFCRSCDAEQRFVADRVCVSGLIGCCVNCGDERIAPFTRVNSEVA